MTTLHRFVPFVGKPTWRPMSIAMRWSFSVSIQLSSRPRATTGVRLTSISLRSLAARHSA
jgi:hypothetical protein